MADLKKIIEQRDKLIESIDNLEKRIENQKDDILNIINTQRWYGFSNKSKVIFDKNTGLLWADLDIFPYLNDGDLYSFDSDIMDIINSFDFEFEGFCIPTAEQLWNMAEDNDFPFSDSEEDFSICGYCDWFVLFDGSKSSMSLDEEGSTDDLPENRDSALLPCSSVLVEGTEYETMILPDNNRYTEREKAQIILDIFLENQLMPIFDNSNYNQIYKDTFYENPKELQQMNDDLKSIVDPPITSSDFDYTILLLNYDIKAIDKSIIKYYQAVQNWIESLMYKFGNYEKQNESVLGDISSIGITLSKKFKNSEHFSEKENEFFRDRQQFFASKISLGMNSVKTKLLSLKKQADDLEYRIDEIDCGNDAIRQLAVIEREERASFEFIVENTAKIICNALKKVEYFEANHEFVKWIIESWESWTESYHIFKTSHYTKLKESCKEDSIDGEIFEKWYSDWQELRFSIEHKMQPIIEKELRERIPMINVCERTVSQQIISELEEYKNNIDKFYCEERKGIYQNYVFQANGEIQDKLETESRIYKFTAQFQKSLQNIIFNCEKSEDRIFILDWAGSLLDIQIDDIIELIADNEIKEISDTVLTEFSQLKQRNYEFYLADAKSYGEEQDKRDKEFNSLLFKMRKGIVSK